MLHDGRKNFDIEYNLLNLPYTVKQNNELKATYSYIADGTKAKVSAPPVSGGSNMSKACPDGFDYLGSLVFKCENNARTLESTSFGSGRINKTTAGYDINYFITDHLGSTRAIVDNSGNIKEQKDFYAFGMEHQNPNLMNSTNRWGFSGKEKQTTANINYLDFGARMYDEFLGRWFVQDPLAEKYYFISQYAYCGNSPVKYIDIQGLTKYLAITMGRDVRYRGQNLASYDSEIEHTELNNGITGLTKILQNASSTDKDGIGFIALWSHGISGEIFENRNWIYNSISTNDLELIETSVNNGDINFADGAIIYLGACNAGTNDGNGTSFAQKLANITGASVIAATNDQVGPKNESKGKLIYTTYYPNKNQFNWFGNKKTPISHGSEADVMSLLNTAKDRTTPAEYLKPLPDNSWNQVFSLINSWLRQNPNITVTIN
jgi:RHS repeat-associated protein